MSNYRQLNVGPYGALPPAIKNIIFINGIIFLMQVINSGLNRVILTNFALSPQDVIYQFKIWQLVTYMFLHGGFWHIFFNMFIFWMFGSELEREWGTREFLKYYFITGIGAGIINILLSTAPTIGASGAVYGVMLAYALRYPDRLIYIWFLFPVKVKYLMGFLTVFSFLSTFGAYNDGIAHAAHLGGIVIGFFYLKYWYLFYKVKSTFKNVGSGSGLKSKSGKFSGNKSSKEDDKTEYYRKAIDELLDKINRVGYLNLSDEEKKLLEEGSRYLREHEKNNFN
ncbi:MAG: rhomboid family intramembrane serine protease [Caldithrix sp.]|nr:rhomboid family intramembrane serine protease [Caldithrix sp.]